MYHVDISEDIVGPQGHDANGVDEAAGDIEQAVFATNQPVGESETGGGCDMADALGRAISDRAATKVEIELTALIIND